MSTIKRFTYDPARASAPAKFPRMPGVTSIIKLPSVGFIIKFDDTPEGYAARDVFQRLRLPEAQREYAERRRIPVVRYIATHPDFPRGDVDRYEALLRDRSDSDDSDGAAAAGPSSVAERHAKVMYKEMTVEDRNDLAATFGVDVNDDKQLRAVVDNYSVAVRAIDTAAKMTPIKTYIKDNRTLPRERILLAIYKKQLERLQDASRPALQSEFFNSLWQVSAVGSTDTNRSTTGGAIIRYESAGDAALKNVYVNNIQAEPQTEPWPTAQQKDAMFLENVHEQVVVDDFWTLKQRRLVTALATRTEENKSKVSAQGNVLYAALFDITGDLCVLYPRAGMQGVAENLGFPRIGWFVGRDTKNPRVAFIEDNELQRLWKSHEVKVSQSGLICFDRTVYKLNTNKRAVELIENAIGPVSLGETQYYVLNNDTNELQTKKVFKTASGIKKRVDLQNPSLGRISAFHVLNLLLAATTVVTSNRIELHVYNKLTGQLLYLAPTAISAKIDHGVLVTARYIYAWSEYSSQVIALDTMPDEIEKREQQQPKQRRRIAPVPVLPPSPPQLDEEDDDLMQMDVLLQQPTKKEVIRDDGLSMTARTLALRALYLMHASMLYAYTSHNIPFSAQGVREVLARGSQRANKALLAYEMPPARGKSAKRLSTVENMQRWADANERFTQRQRDLINDFDLYGFAALDNTLSINDFVQLRAYGMLTLFAQSERAKTTANKINTQQALSTYKPEQTDQLATLLRTGAFSKLPQGSNDALAWMQLCDAFGEREEYLESLQELREAAKKKGSGARGGGDDDEESIQ